MRFRRLRVETLELRTPLAGDLAWVNPIGGGHVDIAREVAADQAGNVYFAGDFTDTCDFDPGPGVVELSAPGSLGSSDPFLAKYSPAGGLLWIRHLGNVVGAQLEYATDVKVDPFGNVWAAASDVGELNGYLIKFDADGSLLWSGKISRGYAANLAIDQTGNVAFGGHFSGTADLDPGAGTFPVTSTNNTNDAYLAKITNAGVLLWAKTWGGSASDVWADGVYDVAFDAADNIYVQGVFEGTVDMDPGPGVTSFTAIGPDNEDTFVSKFSSSGDFVWSRAFLGNAHVGGIAVDAEANVITTGLLQSVTDFDPGPGVANVTPARIFSTFVSKLDTNGNYVWAATFGGGGRGIEVDDNGDIYTTGPNAGDFDPGTGTFTFSGSGIYISRLNKDGRFISAHNLEGQGINEGFAIALNRATKEILVAGNFSGTIDFDPGTGTAIVNNGTERDIFVAKLRQSEMSGRVWYDQNGNGTFQAGEVGVRSISGQILSSVNATLGDADDRVIADIVTDLAGSYRFITPHAGNYYFRVTQPAGSLYSQADVGSDDSIDSDVLPAFGRTGMLTQVAGVPLANIDAGLIPSQPSSYSVTASASAFNEGNAGQITPLVFTIARQNTAFYGAVQFALGGTADGTDYNNVRINGATQGAAGTLTFATGAAVATITVDVLGDAASEQDETISLTLSNPDGGLGTLTGTNPAVATIVDDETTVTIAGGPPLVSETGFTNLVYTLTRSTTAAGALTVNVLFGGTASDGVDYVQTGAVGDAALKTVTFAAGSLAATVTLDPTGDPTLEGDETLSLSLQSGPRYTIGAASLATATITDIDQPPTISGLANLQLFEDQGGSLTLTIGDLETPKSQLFVTAMSSNPVVVPIADPVFGGPATRILNVLPVANASGTATITVTVQDGIHSTQQSFGVTVAPVNDRPTDVFFLPGGSLPENVPGAVLGGLFVNDVDPGDSHTFSFSDNRFEAVFGQLRLKAGQSLNFETEPSIPLTIVARDTGGLETSRSFTIAVADVNEPPVSISLGGSSIAENAAGAAISVAAADPDAGDALLLSVSDSRFEIARPIAAEVRAEPRF